MQDSNIKLRGPSVIVQIKKIFFSKYYNGTLFNNLMWVFGLVKISRVLAVRYIKLG